MNDGLKCNMSMWIKLAEQNRYHGDTVKEFQSIKDVFKQRIQFNPKVKRLNNKFEKVLRIGHKEIRKHSH